MPFHLKLIKIGDRYALAEGRPAIGGKQVLEIMFPIMYRYKIRWRPNEWILKLADNNRKQIDLSEKYGRRD
ncbi:hypothetical protein [Peribacillus sp. SCS-155]|uniref:hypothetical protein n=1 Tax=Peribacillus sedimenti TaxID=3115297 RepID=UPI0039058876